MYYYVLHIIATFPPLSIIVLDLDQSYTDECLVYIQKLMHTCIITLCTLYLVT